MRSPESLEPLVANDFGNASPATALSLRAIATGLGAHPVRELCVVIGHGGSRLHHDQQVQRGLPWRPLLRWQRVHRPSREPVPGWHLIHSAQSAVPKNTSPQGLPVINSSGLLTARKTRLASGCVAMRACSAASMCSCAHQGVPACRKGRWKHSGWTRSSGASTSSLSLAPPPTSRCASQRLHLS